MFTKLREAVVHSAAFTDLEFLSKKKMIQSAVKIGL